MNIAFWNGDTGSPPASPSLLWSHSGVGSNAKIDIKKNGVTQVLPTLSGSGTFPVVIGDSIDVHITKASTDGSTQASLVVKEGASTIHTEVVDAPIFYTFSIALNVTYTITGGIV